MSPLKDAELLPQKQALDVFVAVSSITYGEAVEQERQDAVKHQADHGRKAAGNVSHGDEGAKPAGDGGRSNESRSTSDPFSAPFGYVMATPRETAFNWG